MLSLFLATAAAVGKVALIAGGGVWLGRRGILDGAGNALLSRVVFNLLLPCLLFSKISSSISWETLRVLWILPVLAVVYVGIGFLLGLGGARALRLPVDQVRQYVAASAFGNSGYLPMVLIVTMAGTVPALREIEGAGDLGVSYVAVYLIGLTACLWGGGYPYLGGIRLRTIRWDKIFTPPIYALLAGAVVGLSPLRHLLHGASPPLAMVAGAVDTVGMATIPCAIVVLGGNLARGPVAGAVPWRATAGVVVTRLLVMPLVGLAAGLLLLRIGLIPRDNPILLLVVMLESAMPSAANLVVMCQLHGRGEQAMATTLFWVYLISLGTLAVYGSLYLHMATG